MNTIAISALIIGISLRTTLLKVIAIMLNPLIITTLIIRYKCTGNALIDVVHAIMVVNLVNITVHHVLMGYTVLNAMNQRVLPLMRRKINITLITSITCLNCVMTHVVRVIKAVMMWFITVTHVHQIATRLLKRY